MKEERKMKETQYIRRGDVINIRFDAGHCLLNLTVVEPADPELDFWVLIDCDGTVYNVKNYNYMWREP